MYLSPSFTASKAYKGLVSDSILSGRPPSGLMRGGYASMNTNHSILVSNDVFGRYQLSSHNHNPSLSSDSRLMFNNNNNNNSLERPSAVPPFSSSSLSSSTQQQQHNHLAFSGVPRITITGAAASYMRSSIIHSNNSNNSSSSSKSVAVGSSSDSSSSAKANPVGSSRTSAAPDVKASFNERELFLKSMQAKRKSYV